MAPRPTWKGYLKLSLVSCPVAIYPAASAGEKVSFHLLNGATGHRLKQQYVDGETGDLVERDERIKGYEVAKGEYLHVTDDELADVRIESSHAIDIERFVPAAEIDPVYIDAHHYLVPDDKIGEEAFAVIREAMRRRKMVGIARVVLFGRERIVMMEPRGAGLMVTTLHYAYEVRGDGAYFDEIPKVAIADEMLDLASHIIDTKSGRFDPASFTDRYQEAVVALLQAKEAGRPAPAAPTPETPSNVVNLMDALRKSLGPGAAASPGAETCKAGKASGKTASGKTASGKAISKASAPAKSSGTQSSPAKANAAKAALAKGPAAKARPAPAKPAPGKSVRRKAG